MTDYKAMCDELRRQADAIERIQSNDLYHLCRRLGLINTAIDACWDSPQAEAEFKAFFPNWTTKFGQYTGDDLNAIKDFIRKTAQEYEALAERLRREAEENERRMQLKLKGGQVPV